MSHSEMSNRWMDKRLRQPEVSQRSWQGLGFTGDGPGLVGQNHRCHQPISGRYDVRLYPI